MDDHQERFAAIQGLIRQLHQFSYVRVLDETDFLLWFQSILPKNFTQSYILAKDANDPRGVWLNLEEYLQTSTSFRDQSVTITQALASLPARLDPLDTNFYIIPSAEFRLTDPGAQEQLCKFGAQWDSKDISLMLFVGMSELPQLCSRFRDQIQYVDERASQGHLGETYYRAEGMKILPELEERAIALLNGMTQVQFRTAVAEAIYTYVSNHGPTEWGTVGVDLQVLKARRSQWGLPEVITG